MHAVRQENDEDARRRIDPQRRARKPRVAERTERQEIAAIGDRALRTKDAADSQAKAKLGAIKDNATSGRLVILGNPTVRLGQAIEIKSAPPPQLNGLFKVTSVRHRYGKQEGFLTTLGFTGQGGAKQADGMLGQALGALAGAVGL
jgi:phage protein D